MLWTLLSVLRQLLLFQVLVVPWLLLFVAAFIYVLLFPSYFRPNKPTDRQYPEVHLLQTAGAGLLVVASLELLPSKLTLAASIASFVSANFLVSVGHPILDFRNDWRGYYWFLGWSGFGASVLALSFRLVAAQRDRDKEYSLVLALNLLPMVFGFAVGSFILNFLLIPKVESRVGAFFRGFPARLKREQSRELILYASLLLVLGLPNRWLSFVTTLGSCGLFWFASMMIHYTEDDEGFRDYVNFFVSTYGFAACFISTFLRFSSFRVDANKAYSVYSILAFLSGLVNVSVAVIGNFMSAIRLARQHKTLSGVRPEDVHYPSRAALVLSAVSLIVSSSENVKVAPETLVGLSAASSVCFALSVFLKTIPKPRQDQYRGWFSEFARAADAMDSFFLLTSASISVVNTYCLSYATFLLDKDKSGDVVDVVIAVSTVCNFLLGYGTGTFIILHDNYKYIEKVARMIKYAGTLVAARIARAAALIDLKLREIYNSRLIRRLMMWIADSAAAAADAVLQWSIRISEQLRLREMYEQVVVLLERLGQWFVMMGNRFLAAWDRMWRSIEQRARVAWELVLEQLRWVRKRLEQVADALRPYVEKALDAIDAFSRALNRGFYRSLELIDKALDTMMIRKGVRGMILTFCLYCSSYGIQGPICTSIAAFILLVTPKLYSGFMFNYLIGSTVALSVRKPGNFVHVTTSVMNGLFAALAIADESRKIAYKRRAQGQNQEYSFLLETATFGAGNASLAILLATFLVQQPHQKLAGMIIAHGLILAGSGIKEFRWDRARGAAFTQLYEPIAFATVVASVLYSESIRAIKLDALYAGLVLSSISLGISSLAAFTLVYQQLVRIATR